MLLAFLDADLELALADGIALRGTFSAGTDFEDPADGLADWLASARGAIVLTPATGFSVEAALYAQARRSVVSDLEFSFEKGVELTPAVTINPNFTLSGLLRYRVVSGLAPGYEEMRAGLRIVASL